MTSDKATPTPNKTNLPNSTIPYELGGGHWQIQMRPSDCLGLEPRASFRLIHSQSSKMSLEDWEEWIRPGMGKSLDDSVLMLGFLLFERFSEVVEQK